MPFYEQYAPYREPINDKEEEKLLAAKQLRADTPIDQTAYLRNNRVVFKDPELNTYAQIAYARTNWDLQSAGVHTNTTAHLDHKYPGIDPRGTYCDVDMGYAQRITRLKAAAALCDGVNKGILDDFINKYEKREGFIGGMASSISDICRDIRTTEHAAKVCPEKYVSEVFENTANRMKNHGYIQTMDSFFTAMEQVAGLRGGELDPQTVNKYKKLNPASNLHTQLATGSSVKRNVPETLAVNFQNFENVVWQIHFANPKNWGFKAMREIPTEPSDSPELSACISRYASGTASNALNALFGPTEQSSSKTPTGANRATLVIVDGKTINERMQEIYNNLPYGANQRPNYTDWYSNHVDKLSGEIVAAGLMAGKRVEAYVPGPDGKLPEQPTVVHKTGYAPDPLKPVILNAWERFFNRYGYYQEKAAKAREYQEFMGARERMMANYQAGDGNRREPAAPQNNRVAPRR